MKQVVTQVADADLVKRAQGGDQEAHAQLQKQLQARLETMMLDAVGKVETMLDDGTAGDGKPASPKTASKGAAQTAKAAATASSSSSPPPPPSPAEASSQTAFNTLMASHFVNVDTPEALEAVLKGFERLPESERKRLEGITTRVSELAKKMKSRRDAKSPTNKAALAQGDDEHDEAAFEAAHLEDGEQGNDEHAEGGDEYDDESDEYDEEPAEGEVHDDDDQGVTYDPDPRDRKVLSL